MKKNVITLLLCFCLFTFNTFAQLSCNMWLSDGAAGFYSGNTYDAGDVVYVTGAGLSASFPAVGALYILHDHDFNDGYVNGITLVDVLSPMPNVIQSYLGGGAYIDEIIAIGPLPEGDYDIAIDLNGNGVYDLNTDCYYGLGNNVAFRVRGTNIPAWRLLQLAQIKADALAAALEATDMREANNDLWKYISYIRLGGDISKIFINGKGLKEVLQLLFKKKVVEEYITGPLSYMGLVLNTGKTITTLVLKINELHYHGIAADPPDHDYFNPAPTEGLMLWHPEGIHPYIKAKSNLINAMAIENIALDGIFHSLEKIQGAQADREDTYVNLQAVTFKKYIDLWNEANTKRIDAMDSMRVYILANNMNDTIDKNAIEANKNRVLTTGFTQSELDTFKLYGITSSAQLDSVKATIAAFDTSNFYSGTTSAYLDSLDVFYSNLKITFDTMYSKLSVMVNNISPTIQDHWPHAYITYTGTPTVGAALQLSAIDSNNLTITSYGWDTDKDSLYDNDSSQTITFTPTHTGLHLISAKITNYLGNVDYAYVILDVNSGNKAPVLNSIAPTANHIVIDGSQSSLTFSANFSDPESDPIFYRWIVNEDTISGSSSSRNIMLDTAITNSIANCSITFNTFIIEAYDGNSAYKSGNIWTVLVNPIPEISLPDTDSITCTACSVLLNPQSNLSHSTYIWSTGATTSTISANTAGLYTVTVTANGCSVVDGTLVKAHASTAGIEQIISEGILKLYPNPSRGEITVEYTSTIDKKISLDLINVIGQHTNIVQNATTTGGAYKLTFNPLLYNLGADNVYFLRITAGEDVIISKIIIAE